MRNSSDLFRKSIAKSASSEKLNPGTFSDLNILSSEMKEDEIEGGLSDNMSLSDIAKLHTKDEKKDYKKVYTILKRQLKKGIKTELEHSKSIKVAKEIAKDHLAEDPKYYDNKKKENNTRKCINAEHAQTEIRIRNSQEADSSRMQAYFFIVYLSEIMVKSASPAT